MRFSSGSCKNAATAVTAIHIAWQEGFSYDLSRIGAGRTNDGSFRAILQLHCLGGSAALYRIIYGTLLTSLCHTIKLFQRNNLQLRKHLWLRFSAAKNSCIHDVGKNMLDWGVMKRLSRSLSRALANDCTFFSHFSLLPWDRRLYSNYWIYFLYVYVCHISRDVEVLIHFYTLSGKKAGTVPFGKHASWIGHVPWQNRRLRKDLLVFYCCSWPTATLFYQKVFSLYNFFYSPRPSRGLSFR